MPPEAGTTEESVGSAYAVPEHGPAPAQSHPETRDVAARERTMHDFRGMERRLIPGQRAGSNMDFDEETENLDLELFQQGYDARSRILHEPDAVLDEHERLQEVNALFLDQCMEKYADRVVQTETARDEQKHGRGIFGCMRRWFSETDAGKAVHVAGKAALAGLAAVGTAGTFLAPAGVLMAKKLGTDAALETVQYAFERPVLQNLRELRLRRHDTFVTLQALRNEVANRNDDHDLALNAQGLNITGTLHQNLEEIITEFDNVEREIIEREERLALIKTIGKSVRAVASIAWSAAAIHDLFVNGLAMGTANLDKLADPTLADAGHAVASGVDGAQGMDAAAAAHHVVTSGSNPGVYHDLRMTADGVKFMYEQGEVMSNGLLAHGFHTLKEAHLVGSMYPMAQAVGAYAGFGAAALAGYPTQIYGAIRDAHFADTMQDVRLHPLEERNKPHEAVFTLTGRDALGDSSGVNHEISELAGITRGNEEFRKGLEIKKTKFLPGAIFRVPRSLIGNNIQPLPPFVVPDQDVYIQVYGWDDNGDNKKVDLQYIIIDPNSQRPLSMDPNGIVDHPDSMLWKEAKADNIINQAERVASNYQEFFDSRTEAAHIQRLRTERGHPAVEAGGETSQNWRARNAFELQSENGTRHINEGEIIQIQNLSEGNTRAVVKVFDANGGYQDQLSGVRVRQLMENTIYVHEDQKIPVTENTRMMERRGHEQIAAGEIWKATREFDMTHRDGAIHIDINQLLEVRNISGIMAVVRVRDISGKYQVDYNSVPISEIIDNAMKTEERDMPLTDVDRVQEQRGQNEIQKKQQRIAIEDFEMRVGGGLTVNIEQNSIVFIKDISADKATATVNVRNSSGSKQGEYNEVPLQDLLNHTNVHDEEHDQPVSTIERLREQLGQRKIENGQTWRADRDFTLNHVGGGENVAQNEIIEISNISSDGARASVKIHDASNTIRAALKGVDTGAIYENSDFVDLEREKRERNQRQLKQISDILRNQGPIGEKVQPNLVFVYKNHTDPTQSGFACITAINEEGDGNIAIVMVPQAGAIPSGKALKAAVNNARTYHLTFQEFINRFGTMDPSGTSFIEELVYDNQKLTK